MSRVCVSSIHLSCSSFQITHSASTTSSLRPSRTHTITRVCAHTQRENLLLLLIVVVTIDINVHIRTIHVFPSDCHFVHLDVLFTHPAMTQMQRTWLSLRSLSFSPIPPTQATQPKPTREP